MMNFRYFGLLTGTVLAVNGFPALAQTPQAPPTFHEQALSSKLQDEYNENMRLREAIIESREVIAKLNKQVEELKAKQAAAPATPAPSPPEPGK